MSEGAAGPGGYAEQLRVPLAWWLIASFFLLTFWLALGFYLGWWQGLLATAVLFGLTAWVLIGYGSCRVAVDAAGVQAGAARIDWRWVAEVRALDADETRDRQRSRADARAYLVLRSYLKRSIEVTVDDPADPHPYWLVSCRHPEELAEAARVHLAAPQQ